jgi:hypothetical protein
VERRHLFDDLRMPGGVIFHFWIFICQIVKRKTHFGGLLVSGGDQFPVSLADRPVVSPCEIQDLMIRILTRSVSFIIQDFTS